MANKDRFDEFIARLKDVENLEVKAGILENAPHPESDLGVAEIGFYNEYGVPSLNIPPRPFMQNAFKANYKTWNAIIEREITEYVEGKRTLESVGEEVAGQMEVAIIRSIKSNIQPDNKEATKARKRRKRKDGATRGTLIDTSTMLRSIASEVNR